MKTSIKVLLGLSMPALALAAVWLWGLNRPRNGKGDASRQPISNTHNVKHESQKAPAPDEIKTAKTTTGIEEDSKNFKTKEQLDNRDSLSRSVSLEKEDMSSDKSSSDSHTESSSSDQKRGEFAAFDLEVLDTGENEETWEIEFPQALCGRLIGKKGKNVQKISEITGTKIRLIPQKENAESSQRLVSLTGTPRQLSSALKALRAKFPSVPFTRLNGEAVCGSLRLDCTSQTVACVVLPEHEMFSVLVTNIVDANHFYVQLYDQMQTIQGVLRQLDQQMYQWYTSPGPGQSAAVLPQPVTNGMVCASLSHTGWWWRAQVVGLLMKPEEVEVTWLDYGGKATVPTAMLRQLREDFLQLPFQAVECYLSNVTPHQGESSFSMAACALLEGLTQSVVLTARITSYSKDNCPYLELYAPQWTGQPIFVNREMVRRGFARWSET